jgi:hypothetical protein
MNDCMWLSDRMPAVALGRAGWTQEEADHLHGCSSCREEWELIQRTSRLGEEIMISYDASPAARAVTERLARVAPGYGSRGWRTLAGLAAAAAIVALVWTGTSDTPPRPPLEAGSVVAGLQIPLPELESLQAAELDSVLQTMDERLASGLTITTMESPVLGDLNLDELQRVLDSWEG